MIDRPFHKGDRIHEQVLFQTIRALPEGWYDVTFTPKKRASTAQRGYFHGVVMPLYADYLGECDQGRAWGDDEAWERCKRQFRPREYVDPNTGAVEVVGRSTRGTSPIEFFAFADLVIEWLEGQGVAVPPADKNWVAARERAMKQREVA